MFTPFHLTILHTSIYLLHKILVLLDKLKPLTGVTHFHFNVVSSLFLPSTEYFWLLPCFVIIIKISQASKILGLLMKRMIYWLFI